MTVITALPVWEPAVTVRVAVWFPGALKLTVLGVTVVTKPQAQPLAVALRLTGPLKLPTLVTVIVEFTDVPAGIVSAVGLAERMKPCTTTNCGPRRERSGAGCPPDVYAATDSKLNRPGLLDVTG